MTYLDTPTESPLYPPVAAERGYLPNYTRVFALAPEVYAAWQQVAGAVKAGMDQRRYALATLAASRGVGSAYCGLAHAAVLRERFYDDETLRAIVTDHHDAGLAPVDVAVMDVAGRVAADPAGVTAADVELLREHGLSEADILHVVLAACLRRFFSGVLTAVDAAPDSVYEHLDPALWAALDPT